MKFSKRLLLSSFIVLTKVCEINAQNPSPNSPIPLTPNAASIAQYGNVPIGLYTGQPNVSFPLYEINNGYVKVPITLAYNYNGLKVEDYPGWVGTGWTLNVPGVITRQIRSLPDEGLDGFNGEHRRGLDIIHYLDTGVTPSTPNLDFQAVYPSLYALLTGVVHNTIDSEPDQFTFSIPGYSGKFYFDESQCYDSIKTATIVPHQNITIKGHFNYSANFNTLHGRISKFEVTDERGNIYTFAQKERTRDARIEDSDDGNPDPEFENTWYLSFIKDPFNQYIQYHYKPNRKIAMPPTVSERLVVPLSFNSHPAYHQSDSWEAVIDRITFRNGMLEFIEDTTARLDWDYSSWTDFNPEQHGDNLVRPKALDKIRVTVHGKVIKEVQFNYSYFGNNARLRLDSFQEKNGAVSIPPYEFSYNTGYFPRIGDKKDLFSQDHWGYYTGDPQTTLLPPIVFYTNEGALISLPGNNRISRADATAMGILTKIQYPTGGTTQFEYEQNSYDRGSLPFLVPNGQCDLPLVPVQNRSLSFVIPPTIDKTREITELVTMVEDGCAKIEYRLSAGNCIDNWATILLKRISTGETIFVHSQRVDATGTKYEGIGPESGVLFNLKAGSYELLLTIGNPVPCDPFTFKKVEASVTLSTTAAGNPADFPNLPAGGMRVSKIQDCNNGNIGCITKHFSYIKPENPTHSSGILVSAPVYVHEMVVLNERHGLVVSDLGLVYEGSSQLPVVTTQGNPVGYQYVTVTEGEGGAKGKSIFEFTIPQNSPSTAPPYTTTGNSVYPFPPLIDNDHKRGIQTLEQDFAANNASPIKTTSITPVFHSYKTLRGLRVGPKHIIGDALPVTGANTNALDSRLTEYHLVPYNIESYWKSVSTQVETLRDLAKNTDLTTETSLFYESTKHMQVTRKEVVNSANEVLTSTYTYTDDVANLQGLSAPELAGIQSCPDKTAVIEEKQFRDSILTMTKRNLYNGVNPSKVQAAVASNPLEDEITFTNFDAQGNLLSFTTKKGETHSYLYGYNNTLAVAHVLNATYNSIFFESFEETGTLLNEATAKTGLHAFVGSSYTIPASFNPPNPSSLKMSYWYWQNNKWNFSGEIPFTRTITTTGSMLDEVRAYRAGARMLSFCYKPGIGMISKTDERNMTQYFEYDDMGRLLVARDNERNIINGYDYYYKNGK